jgi:hypothetical protein
VQRALGWLLLPLGQHALYAYSAHVILVVAIATVVAPFNLGYPGPQWLNALIQIASVLLIWALVHWQLLTPTPRTKRYWYASPIALAIIALIALRLDPSPTHPGLKVAAAAAPVADVRAPRRFGTPIPKNAAALPPKIDPWAPHHNRRRTTPGVSWRSSFRPTRCARRVRETIFKDAAGRWFYSPELTVTCLVHIPVSITAGGRRYLVLYMPGWGYPGWIVYGLINAEDRAIRTGDIRNDHCLPQGDKDYWVDHMTMAPAG